MSAESLVRSVSGVRGRVGISLFPETVARYAAAFGTMVRGTGRPRVALARDSRTSGGMFAAAAAAGLASVGVDVVDLGMVPTPTAQLAVERMGLGGGIVVTASHNGAEWNALKFIGALGRFLPREEAESLFALADGGELAREGWARIGRVEKEERAVAEHLENVLGLSVLDVERVRARRFRVALDCVRGAGVTVMPPLLEALGCTVHGIHLEPDGRFPREPEPTPEHLGELGELVRASGADLGLAVDPDVDRLAVVDETGRAIGEDYTLAFAVRAVLGGLARRGAAGDARPVPTRSGARVPVVANLSTSLVVDDAAREFGRVVERAPVGEAHVVARMLATGAEVGGEGNGGVILPEIHLGRDAVVGAALVLELLAAAGAPVSALVARAPRYHIVKAKVAGRAGGVDALAARAGELLPGATVDASDGVRLALGDRWVHVRPSGTEPVVRVIAEAPTAQAARDLVERAMRALDTAA